MPKPCPPTPDNPLRARGEAALRAGKFAQAEDLLERALEKKPNDARSLMLLGDLTAVRDHDLMQALGLYMLAVQADPSDRDCTLRFALLSGEITELQQFNPLLKTCLVACLETPDIDCTDLQKVWYLSFRVDPAFSSLFRLKDGGAAFDGSLFDSCRDLGPLLDPFFVRAVERMIIYATPFEDFLTVLRRRLLDRMDDSSAPLAAALARYCFSTEYVFSVSEEETRKVETLRQHVEAGEASETDIALLASYMPLFRTANAAELEARYGGQPGLGPLVRAQMTDYTDLVRRKEAMKSLTEIGGGASHLVRAQYEEFPYPQWSTVRDLLPTDLFWGAKGKGAKILVAGGGTGNEAAVIAKALPDADILSIDLSRMSLAYGEKKAESFGLKNITFRHADILKLGSEGEKFDIITCTGVLVCMDDPMQGWRALLERLRPGGLLRIGLYSEVARAAVVKSRAIIAEKNIPATPEGMRAFRSEIDRHIGREMADVLKRNSTDFYHMSMLRDMLFHVLEHRFTIPQIRAALEELGLEFITFIVPLKTLEQYRAEFPSDPGGSRLDNWEVFEKNHPDAFLYMYQFWCRRA